MKCNWLLDMCLKISNANLSPYQFQFSDIPTPTEFQTYALSIPIFRSANTDRIPNLRLINSKFPIFQHRPNSELTPYQFLFSEFPTSVECQTHALSIPIFRYSNTD